MKVDKPDIVYENVLDDCIDDIRNLEKRKYFKEIKERLKNDQKHYLENARDAKYFKIQKGILHSKYLFVEDHKWLYDERFVRSKKGRIYYDKILNKFDICLYCGIRDSTTLDHFLSKSVYPNFSIYPVNLIPCCGRCNTNKGNYELTIDDEEHFFLHPYFDDFNMKRWLDGFIQIIDNDLYFDYYVEPSNLTGIEYLRINYMVEKLELKELYIKKANLKFKREENKMYFLYKRGGKNELKNLFELNYSYLRVNDENDFEKVYYFILKKSIDILSDYFDTK